MAQEGRTCKDIILGMPPRFNAEAAGDWKAVIQFRFSGPKGGDYHVTIGNRACSVADGVHPAPTATVMASDETWLGIFDKSVDAMMAFMTGKLQVQGNVGDVMKMRNPEIFRQG